MDSLYMFRFRLIRIGSSNAREDKERGSEKGGLSKVAKVKKLSRRECSQEHQA